MSPLRRQPIVFLVLLVCFMLAACSKDQPPPVEEPAPPIASEPQDERSTTDAALDEIKRLYDEALRIAPDDPLKWSKEDLQKIGDWEYRVTVLAKSEPEETQARLNELGKDRWEVFWISESRRELTLYLKRPARSYLRMVPLSEVGKYFGGELEGGG